MAKRFKSLTDEIVNVAGPATGGNIAGIGLDPPVHRGKAKLVRRKKFANCEVFVIDPSRYNSCLRAKTRYERYSKFVGEDEIGQAIREYGRANPGESILIQDENTGAMTYLKLGKNSRGFQF